MSEKPIEFVSLDEVKALPLHLDAGGVLAMHGLLNEALTRAHNKAVETAMLSMPDTITYLLRHQAGKGKLLTDFMAANPDLREDKGFVEALQAVEAMHPGWSYEKMLDEAARQARLMRAGEARQPSGLVQPPNLDAADESLNGAL